MSEEYSFPAYAEKVEEMVKEFGGTVMEEYQGHDIKPLWEQKGKDTPGLSTFIKPQNLKR